MTRIPRKSLPITLAVALSFGVAMAQTSSSPGSTSGPATNSSTSATGGQSAPAAQPGKGTRNNAKDQLARSDRKFIQKAAESGLFEVQVAKLAQSKATDPAVKDFASMLVDQHTNANNELTQLANNKHVELPAAPGFMKRHSVNSLAKRSGADFDKQFVSEVGIKDHQKDIKEFEKASKDVKDPDLKAFIDKTLPTLREHLAQAQKLPEAGNNANAMGNKGAGVSKKSSG
jgi:putative membrane protein